MTCIEAEPLLNAYLDSELTATECAGVMRHMEHCAVCTRHYESLAALRHEIASSSLRFDTPESLRRKLRRPPAMRYVIAAAIAATLAVGAIVVPLRSRNSDVRTEVVEDHTRSLLASHLVDVPSSDRHTVKPWFQGKTDFAPFVPDLGEHGFVLAGGRLDILAGRSAPAIVYMRGKHVINVFEMPTGRRPSRPVAAQMKGFTIVHWSTGGIDYWAVSDVSPTDLWRLATLMSSAAGR